MEAVAYSNFRKNLRDYMKQVNDDAEALIVTSKNVEDTIVVMSKRDYDSMLETMRVLTNDYLMEKIRKGDQQFGSEEFRTRELLDLESDEEGMV